MTYLIVGCGNLGSELACLLSERGKRVAATYFSSRPPLDGVELIKCDISNPADVEMLMETLDNELTVFWLAASHNVDKVEVGYAEARKVNIYALESFLSKYSGRIRSFFFSSTDCVYGEMDGETPVNEGSPLRPVNEYGRQKAEAETIVKGFGGTCLRYSLLIGETCSGKRNFYSAMKIAAKTGGTMELVVNSRRPALSYRKAAELTVRLSEIDALPAEINVSSDEFLSKYDIGTRLCTQIGESSACFVPVGAEKIPFIAPRVLNFKQDNSLLKHLLNIDHIESGL